MSTASVSGRLRAERLVRKQAAKDAMKPRKVWPELSLEERKRMADIDNAVIRARGGHPAAKVEGGAL